MQDSRGWYGSQSDCLLSFMKQSDKDLAPQLPQLVCSLRAAHLEEQQTKWSHVHFVFFNISLDMQFTVAGTRNKHKTIQNCRDYL